MFSYAMRSLSVIMTVFYLLLVAGSCSVSADNDAVSLAVPGVSKPVEPAPAVNVLQSRPEISLPLQKAAERYAASTGEKIEFHIQTISGEDYRAALRSKLLAGEQIDLFHLLDADDVNRLSPMLENLSIALPWVQDATADTLSSVTLDDAVFGVPLSLEGVGLIVNQRIFEAAGIELTQIHDFESLSEAFYALRDKIDAGELSEEFPNLTAVTDLAAQDSAYIGNIFSEILLSDSFPTPFAAYVSPSLSLSASQESEHFLQLLARVSAQRTNWKEFPNVTEQRMVEEGLATERIAAIVHHTEIYRRVLDANPDMEGALVLLPVYLENSEFGSIYTGTPAWWAVRADASNDVKRQACGFLTWLYQTEEGGQVLAEEFGLLSPYRTAAVETGIGLHSQLLAAQAQGMLRPQLSSGAPSGWDKVLTDQLNEYFTDSAKQWDDVTAACQQSWAAQRQ